MVPKLSVVMLNYNYSQYIEKAISTILGQSYTPLEFVIIDDCSTDDSVAKIEKLFAGRPNCHLVRHEQNKGILHGLQEALNIAKGSHIYLASSDDYVEPDFFKTAMDLIKRNPDVGICCGKPIFFWGENEESRVMHQYLGMRDELQVIDPEQLVAIFRKSHFAIAGITSIYRRDLMLKYGGFQAGLKSACDGFLIHQIAFRHPIGYVPMPFAALRNHGSSYSAGISQARRVRVKVFDELMLAICREEVAESFKKSGMLLYFGKRFLLHLLCRPKYWFFLPPILAKQMVHMKLKFSHLLKER
ncbi:MAG TPA: glycosyltransferase family 2 protein [Chlamydiales bacterium]|nr:glycosyltransferase family 2 protein [Chlamydiales bacterium]